VVVFPTSTPEPVTRPRDDGRLGRRWRPLRGAAVLRVTQRVSPGREHGIVR